MAKRTERHVRKSKAALSTPAARPTVDRVLELGPGGKGLVPTGYGSPSSALAGMPSGSPAALGGVTAPGKDGQIGTPGNLNVFGFLSGEDYNPDLDGYPMFGKYNQMRLSDAQVAATLLLLKLPLKAAVWIVTPASDDPQDVAIADFVEANLIDDDALARSWQHVLDNAMLKFDFGCSAEEILWGVREESWNAGAAPASVSAAARVIEMAKHGNPWALKTIERSGDAMYSTVLDLAPRLPRTFYRWIEEDGKLTALQQFGPKNGQYGYFNIPVKQLALHVRAREGNNYYGRSVLRTAYPHWWWKSQLYRIDMIGHDRFHVGIPRAALNADYNANTAPLDKLESTLKGLRSHDRAYMVQPFGVTYDIFGAQNTGQGTSGILLSIEHHNLMIARNMLQSFSAQGEQRHGSFGAAKVAADVYFDALEGEANEIGSELKQCVVKPLCDANFDMRGRKYPSLVCTDISAIDLPQLSSALAALATSQVITPDDDLEDWLRELMDAPQLAEKLKGRDRSKQPAAAPAPTPGGPAAGGKSKGKTGDGEKDPALDGDNPADPVKASRRASYTEKGRRFSRKPTVRERAVLDLHGIPSTLDSARAALVEALTTIRRSQLRTVAKRIAQKDGRPTAAFTDIRHLHIKMPQVTDLVKAIRTAQDDAFAYGQQTVADEMKRQGVGAATSLAGNPTAAKNLRTAKSTLVSSAQITARRQSETWLGRTMDEALRLRRTGVQGKDLEEKLVTSLDEDAESGAKRDAAGEINEAFGLGRATAASDWSDNVEVAEYSAILDENTCDPCQELDGETFEIDSPEYFEAMPPYKDCEGRDNCRCVFIYVAKGEAG